MKYLIASDIHGSLPTLEKLLDFYNANSCDMLCLLGDILNYGPRNSVPQGLNPGAIAERLNDMASQIVAVRGNCDSEVDQMLLNFPIMTDYAMIVDNGKRIFLTHGHIYNEEKLPVNAYDILFYGHTHLWKLEKETNGKVVCNTGSITFPKGGNVPTFVCYDSGVITVYDLDGCELKKIEV